MEKEIIIHEKRYHILRLLGHGKGGYSYLAECEGRLVVLKQIHHEPCDYYSFGNKIEAEQRDYVRLKNAGIRIPEMLDIDMDTEQIIKEYIDYECNDYMKEWDFEHWGIRQWLPATSFRPYREEDYEAVCMFLIALNRNDKKYINWNWARFEWMMEHPEFDKSTISSIGLWWEQDKIVGAAIYDMYFGEAFCAVLPEHEALYSEILDYAFRELKDDTGLGIAICDESRGEIEAAEAVGFTPDEQSETVLRLGLDELCRTPLPEGYVFAELDPAERPEDFQWILWQGFDHGTDHEEFKRKDPIIPQCRPHLNKCLSLAVALPDGNMVAYCCVWYRTDTDYAYVEPVCTVPAHREKGLASTLLSEALTRAKALGAGEAYVISDLPFYEKLGFEKAQHFTFYRKSGYILADKSEKDA